MTAVISLPGIGGSGEAHWQTLWERADPKMRRFQPASWDAPDLADWLAALDRALAETATNAATPPLLVAHSLGCLLVAHWAAREGAGAGRRVRGAFLVAPPDPGGPGFPRESAATFRRVPASPLPFPALVVASADDPYAALDDARRRAAEWDAGLVVAGRLGHVNAESGIGGWPQGRALLQAFAAGTRR